MATKCGECGKRFKSFAEYQRHEPCPAAMAANLHDINPNITPLKSRVTTTSWPKDIPDIGVVEVSDHNDPDIAMRTKFTVQGGLRKAADLFESRNSEYGAAYKEFGAVLKALAGGPLTLTTEEDFARYGLVVYQAGKLHRYSKNFHNGGHSDSLEDLSVYSQMLQDIDKNGL